MTFRVYPKDPSSPIYQHYYHKNTQQTLQFVLDKHEQHQTRPKVRMSMFEALQGMNGYNDPSDPDADDNLIHAYQTAERIRRDHPNDYHLQITGLIHDVGKILYTFGEPDWCVVGDIYPVGCAHSPSCVYSEFFAENPDRYDEYGIYHTNVGLDNLLMTYGHDEYLYSVLSGGEHGLPDHYQRLIRYHSFYPLHTYGAYHHLLQPDDFAFVEALKAFSAYDLYSKGDEIEITEETKQYYENLLSTTFPKPLLW